MNAAGRRRLRGLVAAMALALTLAPAASPAASLEQAVKAAYLYKLAPFVEWPADASAGAGDPFAICVQGTDPFGELLDRAVLGQRIGARAIVIQRLARIDGGSGCQMAYIGGSATQPRTSALQALRGAHVLTVTDEANGAGPRGMIHFVIRGGRVRFEVDARQAEAAGVTISSKLLALAVSVVR